MVTHLVPTASNTLLPASYDLLWTLVLVLGVAFPVILALVGYGVVRLAVRHELARRDRGRSQQTVPVRG